jgi:hypothetical protein
MGLSLKCTQSGEVGNFPSLWDAAQAGWRFVTVQAKSRTCHFVFAPSQKVRWLDEALGEKQKKEKE